MGTADATEIAKFNALLHAVTKRPETVAAVVDASPDILEVVNHAAETVLHWLAVENDIAGVRLLHEHGAKIPLFALVHAVQGGLVDMVGLLLGLGANPGRFDFSGTVDNPIFRLAENQKVALSACFRKYGYSL